MTKYCASDMLHGDVVHDSDAGDAANDKGPGVDAGPLLLMPAGTELVDAGAATIALPAAAFAAEGKARVGLAGAAVGGALAALG